MKLKDKDITEIAKMIDNEESVTKIALKFNCNLSSVKGIVARYKRHGLDGILHKKTRENFSPEYKIEIVNRFYSGCSVNSLAIEINVSHSVIQRWIKKYEQLGYNGLKDNRGRPGVAKMGRPRKNEQNNNNKKWRH